MRSTLAVLAILSALAGCLGDSGASFAPAAGGAADDATPAAAAPPARYNLTSGLAGGKPALHEFTGAIPAAADPSPFCCSRIPVAGDEVLPAGEALAQLRITLTWTNDAANQGDLDIGLCVPWWCGIQGADQSRQTGTFTETLTAVTGRFDWWQGDYSVDVFHTQTVSSSGIPFTVTVEVAPLEGALGADIYAVTVPADGKLVGEFVGPFADGDVEISLLVHDESGRPIQHIEPAGAPGSTFDLPLTPGNYHIMPMGANGGTIRLHTTQPAPDMQRIRMEGSEVLVQEVTTPAAASGSFDYTSAPGTYFMWPWFLFDDGAAAQFPEPPAAGAPAGGQRMALSSSSGLVVESGNARLGAQASGQRLCLSCNGFGDDDLKNLVDDDGVYQLAWSTGGGATGRFVLFVETYEPAKFAQT